MFRPVYRVRSLISRKFLQSSICRCSTGSGDDGKKPKADATKLQDLLIAMTQKPKNKVEIDLAKPKGNKLFREEAETFLTADLKAKKMEHDSHGAARRLEQAAEDVAVSLGSEDVSATKSELLRALQRPAETDTKGLSSLLVGMKVTDDKSPETPPNTSRTPPPRFMSRTGFQQQRRMRGPGAEFSDVFGGRPLDIFEKDFAKSNKTEASDDMFQRCTERQLRISLSHAPRNGFEEMIQWTESGKLWYFPIDNEQDMNDEKATPWHEHVFLDERLEGWCPKAGPIRQFMELVCEGLSKNPYITVGYKHKTIEFYKSYFLERKELLQKMGAL